MQILRFLDAADEHGKDVESENGDKAFAEMLELEFDGQNRKKKSDAEQSKFEPVYMFPYSHKNQIPRSADVNNAHGFRSPATEGTRNQFGSNLELSATKSD
jgi:hypothetical protein